VTNYCRKDGSPEHPYRCVASNQAECKFYIICAKRGHLCEFYRLDTMGCTSPSACLQADSQSTPQPIEPGTGNLCRPEIVYHCSATGMSKMRQCPFYKQPDYPEEPCRSYAVGKCHCRDAQQANAPLVPPEEEENLL
jgi:hypothetical protein